MSVAGEHRLLDTSALARATSAQIDFEVRRNVDQVWRGQERQRAPAHHDTCVSGGRGAGNGVGADRASTRLLNSDGIAAMDRASALDCRVDTDLDVVVLCRRAQDARIPRQVPLGQGRHYTAATGPGDPQANRFTDNERVTNPSILDEALFT